MLVYIGVYFLLSWAALTVKEQSQRFWLIFFSIFLLWFMGARNEVGCDWSGYYHRFLITPLYQSLGDLFSDFDEPGFWLLTKFVRENDLSYMWLNMFATIIIVSCLLRFCRAHRDGLLILALLFPVVIVQLSMSGIRQGLAVGFITVASVSWMRGSKLWTAIWILVAAQFHTSALMFLPIAPLAGRKVTGIALFGSALILGPVAVMLLGDRFETYSDRYLESDDITSGGALIRYVLVLMPALFFLKYREKLGNSFSDSFQLMRLTTALTFSLIPVAFFSSILLHRVIYYVMPLSIVTFAALGRVAFPRLNRGIVLFLPVLLYGSYTTIWFLTSRHADICYLPYKNFWGLSSMLGL
ncbi:EpsG family protein [Marimonas sp. MJW-29]|uniref:EpsG family protein n=1 Tax=Sulfitobacter sediminis TaxID=3234186 RepID=A0ABV3RMX7_9RHOB